MKTKYKYIHFVLADIKNDSVLGGRLKRWICRNNKSKFDLGIFHFNDEWKCWEFCPNEYTGFTINCLADIIGFMKQLEKK